MSVDLTSFKLLIFTCGRDNGIVSCYILNLSDKEISKIKMREEIVVGIHQFRHYFGCFEMGLDAVSEEFNQALVTIKKNGKTIFYLTEYDETTHSLKVISQA